MLDLIPDIFHQDRNDSMGSVLKLMFIVSLITTVGFLVWNFLPDDQNVQAEALHQPVQGQN